MTCYRDFTVLQTDELIVGSSAASKDLKKLIDVVAPSSTTVLILGETGVGKELVAQAIHNNSNRTGDLISVNCAAIPTELLESELFGHEKGAFTGADKNRKGRFEMADDGTLFLDEIGDMPLPLQSKLLRALEDRTIQRVGGGKDIKVDFRLVCATHQNIQSKVDDGSFRADLYYRINVFPIQVPTLAERTVDIPQIVERILSQMGDQDNIDPPTISDSGYTELSRYTWPGNVRELRNVIERAVVLFAGKSISGTQVRENLLRLKVPDRDEEMSAIWDAADDLSGISLGGIGDAEDAPLPHPSHYRDWFSYFETIDLRRHLRDIEVVLIEASLEKSEGMVSQAAAALKLRRTTLIEKMKKLMIEKPVAQSSTLENID